MNNAVSKRRPIYRIKYANNRFGAFWSATPEPGYSPLIYPIILGGTTLAAVVDRAYGYMAIVERGKLPRPARMGTKARL